MSGTVADVLRVAEGELGKTDGAKYFNYFGYPDLGAWCVAGGRWNYAVCDVDCHWETFYAFDYSDAPAQYVIDPYDLQPGDFASFDWDDDRLGDHVGIVKSVHDWGICTYEYNTDWGRVAEKQRVWACVICGIRPTFAQEPRWVKAADGRWWYQRADGSYPASCWMDIDGERYRFDRDGWLMSGWFNDGTGWFYLWPKHDGHFGEMCRSTCIKDGDSWYALGPDGAMLEEVTVNLEHDGTFGALVLS